MEPHPSNDPASRAGPDTARAEPVRIPDGLTPPAAAAVAVSQLIWRGLGPHPPRRPQILCEWAGLSGPAPTSRAMLARHSLAEQSLTGWRHTVQHAASALELPQLLAGELTRASNPGEDHQARQRQARLFNVSEPTRQPPLIVSRTEQGLTKIAARILAALGPLPVQELAAAMSRTRPPTGRTRTITATQLAALALTSTRLSIDPDTGLCRLTHPHPAYPPDLRILELARKSGRSSHDRVQMIELLTTVGYRRSIEPTLAKHPLLIHTARGFWSIRTPNQPPGPPSR